MGSWVIDRRGSTTRQILCTSFLWDPHIIPTEQVSHGKMRLREVKGPAHITQPTGVASSSPHQDKHLRQRNWIWAQRVCRFPSSAPIRHNHLFAKQPTPSLCHSCGSLPSPAREPQKCRHIASLASGTGLGKRRRWAKREEFPSLPWLLPHDAESLS